MGLVTVGRQKPPRQAQSAEQARPVVGYGSFNGEDIGMVEVEFLGHFKMTVAPGKARSAGAAKEAHRRKACRGRCSPLFPIAGRHDHGEGQPPVSAAAFGGPGPESSGASNHPCTFSTASF